MTTRKKTMPAKKEILLKATHVDFPFPKTFLYINGKHNFIIPYLSMEVYSERANLLH